MQGSPRRFRARHLGARLKSPGEFPLRSQPRRSRLTSIAGATSIAIKPLLESIFPDLRGSDPVAQYRVPEPAEHGRHAPPAHYALARSLFMASIRSFCESL